MHNMHDASTACASTPANEKAPDCANSRGPEFQSTRSDCAEHGQTDASPKELARLQAEAALIGCSLHRIVDESGTAAFLIGRWAWTRSCPSLADARALVERMGCRR